MDKIRELRLVEERNRKRRSRTGLEMSGPPYSFGPPTYAFKDLNCAVDPATVKRNPDGWQWVYHIDFKFWDENGVEWEVEGKGHRRKTGEVRPPKIKELYV